MRGCEESIWGGRDTGVHHIHGKAAISNTKRPPVHSDQAHIVLGSGGDHTFYRRSEILGDCLDGGRKHPALFQICHGVPAKTVEQVTPVVPKQLRKHEEEKKKKNRNETGGWGGGGGGG